jgi:molybdenum cofactor cytidylyltransferase
MEGFWSIILAAGESKRMGFPKMLLTFNGQSMIERVIENVAGSDSDNILVVLGAYSEEITNKIGRYNVSLCFNENYMEGMLSSVRCGFKNLPPVYRAVLVFQGDQPFISPVVINSVIKAYLSSDKGIVMPVFKGKRGHPLLIDRKYREEINTLEADKGLRSLSSRFPGDVLEVETGDHGIMRDFDTYEDYMNEIYQKQ